MNPTYLKGSSTKTNVPGNNATCSTHFLRYPSPTQVISRKHKNIEEGEKKTVTT